MTEEKFCDFVRELSVSVPKFVENMESKTTKGKYRFSWSGDYISQHKHWGLGQSAFAARILYILNALDDIKAQEIGGYILSFEGRNGEFYDPQIAKKTFIKRIAQSIYKKDTSYIFNKMNMRAETRQAVAALINLNIKPNKFFQDIEFTESVIGQYINHLDWSKPWSAASHLNHQLFFLRFTPSIDENIKYEILELFLTNLRMYEHNDGFYKPGNTLSPNMMIGGMMKTLMGLSLFDRADEFAKNSFIDLCLDGMIACDACENFNTIYTLYQCSRATDYRNAEIRAFALGVAQRWKEFYFPHIGGFSFYKGKSGYVYYDAKVSKGLNEPDLHGTAMFVWGYLIIAKLLGLDDELSVREPIL